MKLYNNTYEINVIIYENYIYIYNQMSCHYVHGWLQTHYTGFFYLNLREPNSSRLPQNLD